MSYFHTGIRTIIGAEAFHGPVRDGKAWGHLAMAARHKLGKLEKPRQSVLGMFSLVSAFSNHVLG